MCHKNVTLWNLMKHWSLWVYIWSYHTKYTYVYFKMPSKFYSLILIYAVLSRIYTIFGGQFSGLKMRWGRKKLQISDLVISCTMQCLSLRASLLVNSLHLLKNVPEHLVLSRRKYSSSKFETWMHGLDDLSGYPPVKLCGLPQGRPCYDSYNSIILKPTLLACGEILWECQTGVNMKSQFDNFGQLLSWEW